MNHAVILSVVLNNKAIVAAGASFLSAPFMIEFAAKLFGVL